MICKKTFPVIPNRYLSIITGKIYNSQVLKLMWRPENLDCAEHSGLPALKIQLIPSEVFKRPVSNGRKLTGRSSLRGKTPISLWESEWKPWRFSLEKWEPPSAGSYLRWHLSISNTTLEMTWQIFFSPSKFSSLLFRNPAHKTKTGTANRCATTDRKPRGPTIVMGPTISKAVRSHLIRYFLQAPFTSQGSQRD